jgi:hypothetical protein
VLRRADTVRVSASYRRYLARRRAQSQPGSCGEHFDAARAIESRRDAAKVGATEH